MDSSRFWTRWLVTVGFILIGFGLAMATLNGTRLFEVAFNRQIDPVFWPTGLAPAGVESFQRWIYGVLGATVAGWGVLVAFIAANPFKERALWAWHCLFLGFALWFVTDTAISVYFGVLFNAFFNCLLVALVYIPLAATRRQFK